MFQMCAVAIMVGCHKLQRYDANLSKSSSTQGCKEMKRNLEEEVGRSKIQLILPFHTETQITLQVKYIFLGFAPKQPHTVMLHQVRARVLPSEKVLTCDFDIFEGVEGKDSPWDVGAGCLLPELLKARATAVMVAILIPEPSKPSNPAASLSSKAFFSLLISILSLFIVT